MLSIDAVTSAPQALPKPPATPPPCQPNVTMLRQGRAHPDSAGAIQRVDDYFLDNWPFPSESARKSFKKADLALFTCLTMPEALDDRIELACCANNVLFIMDDILDAWSLEKAQKFYQTFESLVWGTKENLSNPLEVVVANLFAAIRAKDVPEYPLGEAFCRDACEWFRTAVSSKRNACDTSSLDEYLHYRLLDAGCWMTIKLAFWSMQIDLAELRKIDIIRQLELKALQQGALVNDLYSYRREVMEAKRLGNGTVGAIMVNAVTTVMNEQKCDESQAIKWLEEHCSVLEREFEDLAEKAAADYEGEQKMQVDVYAEVLRDIIVGNWEWSRVCGRYNF